jgi:undecaprenyl-diphosphatase
VQKDLESGTIIFEIAGALWLGNDRQFGHTLFQSVDSSLIAGVAAQGMKLAFGRARPEQGNDPDQWFKGRCCSSFPSGEVTLQASFVTPIILQYHAEHPWIWSLETLPLYSSIARVKSQAHWQTDVLAGWALGTGVGYWASSFKTPFVVQMLPRGMTLGYHRQF